MTLTTPHINLLAAALGISLATAKRQCRAYA